MQAFMIVCIIAFIVMNYETVPLTERCPLKCNLCIKRIKRNLFYFMTEIVK